MKSIARTLLFTSTLLLAACRGGGGGGSENVGTSATAGTSLTDDELEKGIGPIRAVAVGDVDAALAAAGETIFTSKCSACHKFETRYVGPPLGDVLERRSPEFVMNMMLNPQEMVERHPEARALLAQYMTPMPSQNLTEGDARALLEYIRTQQTSVSN